MARFMLTKFILLLISLYETDCHETNGNSYDISNRTTRETNGSVLTSANCSQPWCETYSPSEVKNMFPGVFFTKEQLEVQKKKFSNVRMWILQQEGIENVRHLMTLPGDGDSCCVTEVEAHIETSWQNIEGLRRTIVHMPPLYQFIPEASCGKPGLCKGKCVLEPVMITLLIYDHADRKMLFDHFPAPGYCSCKRDFSIPREFPMS